MMSQQSPTNPLPKRQHYVPRLLLRCFCPQGSDRLWVFDKQTDREWEQAIREIGHEKYFNEVPLGDSWFASYEDRFQYIESHFASVLAKLNADTPVHALTVTERAWLCYFTAVQHLRTPAFFAWNKQLNEVIGGLLPPGETSQAIEEQVGPLTDAAAKRQSLHSAFQLAEEISRALAAKVWILHEAYPNRSFYVSDAPVVLHNGIKDETRSAIGFAVPGIEIYMPISAALLVGAYCPILVKELEEAEPFRTVLKTGERIRCDPPNMDFYNSLQVANAERFVYSRNRDFDLARRILEQHPHLRKPRRVGSNMTRETGDGIT
ncbi:MAG: DUF4238 domain-containing protein [Phycisphaerae bacterium]|nr:DUF4238 domain-containing protein [Phycisphaerae bacterium]